MAATHGPSCRPARKKSCSELTRRWRKKIGSVPDAESVTYRSEIHGAGNPIEIHLSMDDNDQLVAAAEGLKAELGRYPGVFDTGLLQSLVPDFAPRFNLRAGLTDLIVSWIEGGAQVNSELDGFEDRLADVAESTKRAVGTVVARYTN